MKFKANFVEKPVIQVKDTLSLMNGRPIFLYYEEVRQSMEPVMR